MCCTVTGAAEADQEGSNLLAGYREHVPELHVLVSRLSEWSRSWLFTVARNPVIERSFTRPASSGRLSRKSLGQSAFRPAPCGMDPSDSRTA